MIQGDGLRVVPINVTNMNYGEKVFDDLIIFSMFLRHFIDDVGNFSNTVGLSPFIFIFTVRVWTDYRRYNV